MNYVYDIYLNFNNELYDFFDWNKNDKLTHIESIPIIKTNEEIIKQLITNDIKISKEILNKYRKKTSNRKNEKSYFLFCDTNNVIAIEFNSNGLSLNKSYLQISDELEILENINKYKKIDLNFKTIKRKKQILKTRKERKNEEFIKKELSNTNPLRLQYIFFECFGKQETNTKIITKKLLNLSKDSKSYNNLYNILKITSTTTK